MPSHKVQRATQDIKRELADLMRQLKDPRITGMISIVDVDLSGDFSKCTVYVSSLESFDAAKQAVEGLKSAAGFLRREIGSRMRFRRTPELIFVPDDGIAHSAGIHKILLDLDIPSDEPEEEVGEHSDED